MFFESQFSFCLQLTDIDLHKYYSKLEPETPTDEEASKRPIVISLRNASFRYHRFNQDDGYYQSNGGNQSFSIGPVTGDIKKVMAFQYRLVFAVPPYLLSMI